MADMEFECPGCRQTLEAPEDMAGDIVECPACGTQIAVPAPEATDPVDIVDTEDLEPRGVEGDDDFRAGSDIVHYRIPVARASAGLLRIEVRLVHQPVGARWLAEWSTYDLAAVRLLEILLHAERPTPFIVSTLEIEVRPEGGMPRAR